MLFQFRCSSILFPQADLFFPSFLRSFPRRESFSSSCAYWRISFVSAFVLCYLRCTALILFPRPVLPLSSFILSSPRLSVLVIIVLFVLFLFYSSFLGYFSFAAPSYFSLALTHLSHLFYFPSLVLNRVSLLVIIAGFLLSMHSYLIHLSHVSFAVPPLFSPARTYPSHLSYFPSLVPSPSPSRFLSLLTTSPHNLRKASHHLVRSITIIK